MTAMTLASPWKIWIHYDGRAGAVRQGSWRGAGCGEFVAWWLLRSPCANKLQLHAMPIKEVLRQDDGMTMTQKPRT